MTEFNLKLNCIFCQSKIGSKHCLLPFQLTESHTLPENALLAMMDATEIHMKYGTESLLYNFNFINSFEAERLDITNSRCHEQAPPSTSQWSEIMNDHEGSNHDSDNQLTTENVSKLEDDYSKWITDQLDEEQLRVKDLPSSNTSTMKSADSGVKLVHANDFEKKSFSAILSAKGDEPDTHVMAEKREFLPKKKHSMKAQVLQLERDEINHTVQDLLLAAKSASNMYANKRCWILTTALIGSICSESQLRDQIGMSYKPSYSTTLDGNKAIAKELIAKHSHDKIESWERDEVNDSSHFCLLNFNKFSIMHDSESKDKLADSLIGYFYSTITSLTLSEAQKAEITENLEFELTKCGHIETFAWINGKSRSLNRIDTSARTGKRSGSISSSVTNNSSKAKSYPPVDQNLIDYINTHLQVVINQEITKAGDSTPVLTDQTDLKKLFFKLATEFLRRNKGWLNENSFTNANHLTKLEESTGLQVRSSESFLVFKILKRIIDEFRRRFKARYSN